MVKIGMIGCGMIAQRAHLPAFAECENVAIMALCDINKKTLKAVGAKYSSSALYTDYKQLLKEACVDAVSIATPNYLHAPMTIAAARVKKHVLVEKPMATTMKELDRMVAAAKNNGVILMVEQPRRFQPAFQIARKIMASGMLGKLYSIRGRLGHGGPEKWSPTGKWFFRRRQAGGGTGLDLGIHVLDTIRFIVERPVVEVMGMTAQVAKKNTDVEDNMVVILRFADGALGQVEAAWTQLPPGDCYDVYCEKGNLFIVKGKVTVKLNSPAGSFQPQVPDKSEYGNPYQYFADCVERGEKPFIDGAEGAKSTEVILAAFLSQKTGKRVKLPLARK